MRVGIFGLLFILFFSVSGASAQNISVLPKYNLLPHPPVTRTQFPRPFMDMASTADLILVQKIKANVSTSDCPVTNRLVRKVFDRIVTGNDLERFFRVENFNVELFVLCPSARGEIATTYGSKVIVIGAPFILLHLNSEDELAQVLSHELSHVLSAAFLKSSFNKLYRHFPLVNPNEEREADENSVVLMTNANYRAYDLNFIRTLARLAPEEAAFGNFDSEYHTPLVLRTNQINNFAQWRGISKIAPTPFSVNLKTQLLNEISPDRDDLRYLESR